MKHVHPTETPSWIFRSKLLDLQKVGIYEIVFWGVSPHPQKTFFCFPSSTPII